MVVEQPENPQGLAFVMHGLGGNKEQPHIRTIAETFLENGYTVVTFDTTNTYGESDGRYEDATITNYYADLEDVIDWARNQDWFVEPFVLAGQSLGGICVAWYAENYPQRVKGLFPHATVVSGELSKERYTQEELIDWQKTGWQEWESSTQPGLRKRLPWSHMEDRLKYDLLPNVSKLDMPVLLIVGSEDTSTPPRHQQLLYDALPGKKELHIVEGAPHSLREATHLAELKQILDNWIKTRLNF